MFILISKYYHEYGSINIRRIFLVDDNNKKHGCNTNWYPTCQKQSRQIYKNGELCGPYTSWYPNDQTSSRCVFKNNKIHGLQTEWQYNGQIGKSTRQLVDYSIGELLF